MDKEPTPREALMNVAQELAKFWTELEELEEPPTIEQLEDGAVILTDYADDGIELISGEMYMLDVNIHHDGPEPGDVHRMEFDFSSAVWAPRVTAKTIAIAAFGIDTGGL